MNSARKKIILDTDIGSDVDDAVSLAWLLREPKCELLGITTVSGDTCLRASLASALCRDAGREEVPIYPGIASPMFLSESRQPEVPQADILANGKCSHQQADSFPQHQAIRFLQETIRANPGEVTLLAIGPLTNLGLLFSVDPEIPSLLKELVIMGGNFTPVRWLGEYGAGRCEWNIVNDPHAAEIVYRADVKIHRSIGIDVTARVNLSPAEVRQRFRCPGLNLVLEMAQVWFDGGRDEVTFHDPLAAVSIFEPDICSWARGGVQVVPDGLMEGYTLFNPDAPQESPVHEVANDVDIPRFFDRYFGNFI
ncbi:nucleoside hydrolase [Coraliomargarita sp. SDUM461004]|uniref:Nucleoside hydrolase n=1 Tax=Thalassobacterium sedimentorum TaxID=3041258 RepID=A0ABU1AH39_9BACT|nr:nucleoside hydrolase [Coraliomargarita sp. SDUM461004]MDQ8193503.1 nucleoside hydrolase [Coraliomargarita sp. SDUM461004]